MGILGLYPESSSQSLVLRDLILKVHHQQWELKDLVQHILSQTELEDDSIKLIIKAIWPQYGVEYLGLGGDDFDLKTQFFESLMTKFPQIPAFRFYYAECANLAGLEVSHFFPFLKQAMLSDRQNALYPSAEVFEAVSQSEFSFELDVLLLEKYYQPCDKETFQQWIAEYKLEYQTKEQIAYLEQLTWRGNAL